MTSESLNRIDRGTLHDRVYQEIRRALMSGDFAPGKTLTLKALAQEVGTSIMPARDALRRLATEHALDLLPNRSIVVPVLTPERLNEIRDIRLALESMAAALAAGRMSDRDLADLAEICEAMHGQRGSPPNDYLAQNHEFHFRIYRAASRPILVAMIETLWLQIGPPLNVAICRDAQRLDPQHYHAVLAALRARNGKAAGRAVAAIVLAVSDLLTGGLRGNLPST